MSVLSVNALTLIDWAKRVDPEGRIPVIVELLAQTNEMLLDMQWIEGNLPTGHRTTVRTGLPAVFWRLLNQGVTPSKSTTAQIDEACGMLEAWSEVDVALARLGGNVDQLRLSEARAFLEAMNQEMQSTVIYGNGSASPEEFTGLAARYSTLSSSVPVSQNVISASGATPSVQNSIWLVSWGEETVHGIFPKGSQAGLEHNDFDQQTVEVTAGVAGSRMRAYQDQYVWHAGIAVKDWRHVVRICNLETATLIGSSPQDLIGLMERAIETLPNRLGNPVFYMNRTVRRVLRSIARKAVAGGGGLTFDNYEGKRIMKFDEIPVRTVDALLTTEAVVT
jgi:hypothetical protein